MAIWLHALLRRGPVQRANGRSVDRRGMVSRTYPLAATELAEGKATDFRDHYYRIGRFRGYLPHDKATRPENPSGFRSHFGGLWTDQGNALDVVAGRLDLGLITSGASGPSDQIDSRWLRDHKE